MLTCNPDGDATITTIKYAATKSSCLVEHLQPKRYDMKAAATMSAQCDCVSHFYDNLKWENPDNRVKPDKQMNELITMRLTLLTLLSMIVPRVHLVHSWSRELSTKSSRLCSELTRLRTALRMMVTSWSRLLPPALMRLNASYSLASRCFSALPQRSTAFFNGMIPLFTFWASQYTAQTGQGIFRLIAHTWWPTASP